MQTTPLTKISIRQLVVHCGVNRQTFYYHFRDIYELVDWIYETEAVDGIADYRTYSTWTEGFHRIFQYIEDNKSFCMNTFHSISRSQLDAHLYRVTYQLLMGVIEELSTGMDVADADKHFMANFYTLAFIGLVTQWMGGGMKEDPRSIIEKLHELVEGNFMKALTRYEKKAEAASPR